MDKVTNNINKQDELVVSNRNIRFILDFCRQNNISEDLILSDLGYPISYLKNPDNWVTLQTFSEISNRVRRLFNNNHNIFYNIGLTATQGGGLGTLETLKNIISRVALDPGFFIKKIPHYNKFFNKTKKIKVISFKKGEAVLRVDFFKHIDPVSDFNSGLLVAGIIASFPKIWNLPEAKTEEIMLPYNPLRLLKEEFSIFAEVKYGHLFIEGEKYGHTVTLVEEKIGDEYHCTGSHQIEHIEGNHKGILITKDFSVNGYPLLKQGQIYNAPYFILKTKWDHQPFYKHIWKKMKFYFPKEGTKHLQSLEDEVSALQNYALQLERKIMERNSLILDEKNRLAETKEKISLILNSHLPPDLIELMLTKKSKPKKQSGVLMFADLVGFSTRVSNTDNFEKLFEELNRYFEITNNTIKSRGGWVYKYLGDGVMAVFGGYKEDQDLEVLSLNAIRSAEKIRYLINDMDWEIRIGIESGEFLSGEIGGKGEHVWDFIGPTVNFASRLEQNSAKNEILLGPNIKKLLADKINTKEKEVNLKGIGQEVVYSFVKFN